MTIWDEAECFREGIAAARESKEFVSNSLMMGGRGLELAQISGSYLNLAKQHIPRGEWLQWVGKYCEASGINYRTAARHMIIDRKFDTCVKLGASTMRQVLLLTGDTKPVTPVDDSPVPKAEIKTPESLSNVMLAFTRWKGRVYDKQKGEASVKVLVDWHEQMKPFLQVYQELEIRLRA